jgi:cytochrome c oxidase accessory protein FixG
MCPYARFQSVMVDQDTFVVTYDKLRGEPRGSRHKTTDILAKGLGDCVDCSICVQVCPTGIDIRDGLQYMCIGCGACIDACDLVMDKMNYPLGLIRYTTERAMLDHETNQSAIRHILRPRVIFYALFITALSAAFLFSLFTRNPLRVDVMRDRGALAREVDGERIENIYRIQIMNSSEHPIAVSLKAKGLEDLTILNSQNKEITEIKVEPASNLLMPIKVSSKLGKIAAGNYPIHFLVDAYEAGDDKRQILRQRDEKSIFIIPHE